MKSFYVADAEIRKGEQIRCYFMICSPRMRSFEDDDAFDGFIVFDISGRISANCIRCQDDIRNMHQFQFVEIEAVIEIYNMAPELRVISILPVGSDNSTVDDFASKGQFGSIF